MTTVQNCNFTGVKEVRWDLEATEAVLTVAPILKAAWSGPLSSSRPAPARGSIRASDAMKRCAWTDNDDLLMADHDHEWGVPVHDDDRLFEFLILEGAQAGLSWLTILKKRENYRRAYDDFDISKVAGYKSCEVKRLLNDPGIVRNKLKINASIVNAKAVINVQKEFGSFDKYLWGFVIDSKQVVKKREKLSDIPSHTPASDTMSKDLKKRGFKFVGTTICYAFMQAVGMVNDHEVSCFRYMALRQTRANQKGKKV